MSNFLKEIYTAYASAHTSTMRTKNWTTPKIYHGGNNFDLTKRWYVYYSFVDPATGELTRQASITMNINRNYKTKSERLKHLRILQMSLTDALKQGYSPYEKAIDEVEHLAVNCLEIGLKIKSNSLKESSRIDYKTRVNQFINYLDKTKRSNYSIKDIDRKLINEYLNHTLDKSSARNRNNVKLVLSSIFSVLVNEEYIEYNFIKEIPNLKQNSKRDKTYSSQDLETVLDYLEKHDKILHFFIEFVSYFFFRPVEVTRLKLENINLKDKLIVDEIKQSSLKTKIIPDIIFEKLQDYIASFPNAKQSDYLFTPNGIGEWETDEMNKRNYFSKRYKKVKDILNIGDEYSIYSFRHTFTTKVYKNLRLTNDIEDTIKKLKLITGHTSDAIHKYIHVLDAELPADYSDLLK